MSQPLDHIPMLASEFARFRFPQIIVLAVRWYLRHGLSHRDGEELLVGRGVETDHVTIGWATNGASRHDVIWFEPTLNAADQRGLIVDIDTLNLDRGYHNSGIRDCVSRFGITDLICAKRREPGTATIKRLLPRPSNAPSAARS